MSFLQIQHLKKVYNSNMSNQQYIAIQDISLEIDKGEYVAVMGASGSGKTTLLNLIAGLDHATSGNILLEDKALSQMTSKEMAAFRREQLGIVFQEYNLLDSFSVKDNILLPLILSQVEYDEMHRRLNVIAEQLGIAGLLMKQPFELSGGEKQRVAIARALISNPKIILADEPTGALDSRTAVQLMKIFNYIHQDGQTILLVTHSAEAASYVDRVIFIRDGMLYSQIYKGGKTRGEFFDQIMNTLVLASKEGASLL